MSAKTPPATYEKTACVVVCRDGPQGAAVRAAQTQAHLQYIETVLDELNIAGPLFAADGSRPIGSLYSLHTKSLDRAREIIENDPYARHGAFASIEFFPHVPAAGRWIGGKIW
ncbi:MAG: hypothetical protein FJ179_05395 [Gammaproteobacteria bacterium]|nr:hypothetical protein [Gammaproteobacteria bacterium]